MADSQPPKKQPFDLIHRGVKRSNVPGTLTFIGLRGLDPLLQYQILAGGWGTSVLAKVGASTILSLGAASNTGIALLDNLDLPLSHLILLGMSVGSFAKQAYWLVGLSAEEFPPSAAVAVSIYNTLVNSTNSLLLLAASTSVLSSPRLDVPGTGLPYQVVLGSVLYAVGMFLETASEWQRKQFKARPENKGKVMRSGLWSWARHINYGGYALWRAGYCMAASGFIGGTIMGVWQAFDFLSRGVPVLNDYCSKRYGEQWAEFKKEVKWVLIPGVY